MSNFAISQSKIVNCQRSPNAVVFIKLKLSAAILDGDKVQLFQKSLEDYVNENPRIWNSLLVFRHDHFGNLQGPWSTNNVFDADYRFVVFTLAFQHRVSWQYAARIMANRSDLMRHIYDICLEMGVQYDNMAPQSITQQPKTKSMEEPHGTAFQEALGQIPGNDANNKRF